MLVMTLSTKRSYDYGYDFFTFDGPTWRQLDAGPDLGRQVIVLREEPFKVWDEPGEAGRSLYHHR